MKTKTEVPLLDQNGTSLPDVGGPITSPTALTALARLLARQAEREWVSGGLDTGDGSRHAVSSEDTSDAP